MPIGVKDNKKGFLIYIRNKKNADNCIGPLLAGNGKMINYNAEKAEGFNQYFCSFGEKPDKIIPSYEITLFPFH